ncbi:Aste57867_4570 [Aphanomyces stellatus]|uniref:Aste57867_4570 protein n=1 Tax=Aphanomyces stellatus TaxID=120398 RepID=A0A485KD18_9STRA|nr:hypothetical protein As57867_004557 [Aphanomyces stellatus]VFT81676.1 Aste57867_4570 [Aphanomyces stellatus]
MLRWGIASDTALRQLQGVSLKLRIPAAGGKDKSATMVSFPLTLPHALDGFYMDIPAGLHGQLEERLLFETLQSLEPRFLWECTLSATTGLAGSRYRLHFLGSEIPATKLLDGRMVEEFIFRGRCLRVYGRGWFFRDKKLARLDLDMVASSVEPTTPRPSTARQLSEQPAKPAKRQKTTTKDSVDEWTDVEQPSASVDAQPRRPAVLEQEAAETLRPTSSRGVERIRAQWAAQEPRAPAMNILRSEIKAPEITSVAREELIKFVERRKNYERDLKSESKKHGGWGAVTPKLWIGSIKEDLLEALCKYNWYCDRETLTEGDFQARLSKMMKKPTTQREPTEADVVVWFKSMHLPGGKDVEQRLVQWNMAVEKILREQQLSEYMKDKRFARLVIKTLIGRINPADLHDRVHDKDQTWKLETLQELSEVIREYMEQFKVSDELQEQRDHSMARRRKRDVDDPSDGRGGKRHQSAPDRSHHRVLGRDEKRGGPGRGPLFTPPSPLRAALKKSPSKYGPKTDADDAVDGKKYGHPPAPVKREWPTTPKRVEFDKGESRCFKCGEVGHMKRDCPNNPGQDGKDFKKGFNRLRRARYRVRNADRIRAKKEEKRVLRIQRHAAPNHDGGEGPDERAQRQRQLKINGALNCLYCPDTGAEQNILPKKILKQVLLACPDVKVIPLLVPVTGTGCNNQEFKSEAYVELSLALRTAAGLVQVPGKRVCYIVEEGDEFLASEDTLKAVGIDIDRILEQIAIHQLEEGDDLERGPTGPKIRSSDMGTPRPQDDLETALSKMVTDAIQGGFPQELAKELWRVVTKGDVWRLKFDGTDPPAKVKPLHVTAKTGCVPYRCKGRKHNAIEGRFLDRFGKELLDAGIVRRNPQSRWCSPVNPVMKPDGRRSIKEAESWTDLELLKYYRLTNDYRVVNSMTEPKAGTMPFQATITQNLRGKQAMGTFDQPKCFWQFPLHEDCQEMLSFMLNGCVVTPNRVVRGHMKSAMYVQQTSEECYQSLLGKNLLVWIDDILLYADDPEEYVQVLEQFLDLVDKFGFKLSPDKTTLFTKEAKWRGRSISAAGVSQDPNRINSLCAVPPPTNAGDLQQFICATNWLRDSITEYAQTVDPLQKRLTKALEGKAKKKRVASGVQVALTAEELAAFEALKEKLRAAVELSHPREDATMCLFTDASDNGWSIIITQHEMLLCQSGMFTGAQLNWSVIKKEAYPIARACDKLNYLLMRPKGFRMYCDHENLIQVFAPEKEWKQFQRAKLTRWTGIIGGYRYTIEHIRGTHNLWADLMSRWGQPRPAAATNGVSVRRRTSTSWTKKKKPKTPDRPTGIQTKESKLRPLDSPDFVWPSVDDIVAAQSTHAKARPDN